MKMTLREVHVALRYIDIRTHNDYASRAAFYGAKIPMKHVDESIRQQNLSNPEDDAILERELRDKQPGMIAGGFKRGRFSHNNRG